MIQVTILMKTKTSETTTFEVITTSPESKVWISEHRVNWDAVESELSSLKALLKRVVLRKRDLSALLPHGQLAFDLLFPDQVKRLLRSAHGALLIHCERFEAPWQLLHDGRTYLGERWAIGTLPRTEGLSVNFSKPSKEGRALVVADPSCDLPAARFEGEAVLSVLSDKGTVIRTDVRFGPVRCRDFIRSFKNLRILHFAGHFDPAAEHPLGWRLDDGHVRPSELLSLKGGGAPELFFSNACRAATATDFSVLADIGVQNYIAPLVDVPDLGSADFSQRFYRYLCEGRAVGEALRCATWDGIENGDSVGLAYRLFGTPSRTYFGQPKRDEQEVRVRRATFVFGKLSTLDVAKSADQRSVCSELAMKHGGQILPGCTAVVRFAFGLSAAREDDRLRALNVAFELHTQQPSAVVIVADGKVETSGLDAEAQFLFEMESACWVLEPGVYGSGSVTAWSQNMTSSSLSELSSFAKLEPSESQFGAAPSPFVARQAELDRLALLAKQIISDGSGRSVTIMGPAGIGKTKLVETFALLERNRLRFVWVSRPSYENVSTWHVFADIVAQVLGLPTRSEVLTDEALLRRGLQTLSDEWKSTSSGGDMLSIDDLLSQPTMNVDLERYTEVFAALLEMAMPIQPLAQELVVEAVSSVVRRRAMMSPICLVLDDISRLEVNARDSLFQLIQILSTAPVLTLMTGRADDAQHTLQDCEQMLISELSKDESKLLVTQILPSGPPRLIMEIVKRAEGNPLFITQLAQGVHTAEMDEVPASIEFLISAQLDALGQSEQGFLCAASVVGRQFDVSAVAVLLSAAKETDSALLEKVLRTDCIRLVSNTQYSFVHQLLHEVVYASIAPARRQALHGRYALWLSESSANMTAQELYTCAHHFQQSGDIQRAKYYRLRSAERAASIGDLSFASRMLDGIEPDECQRVSDGHFEKARFYELLAAGQLLGGELANAVDSLAQAVASSERYTESWARCFKQYCEALASTGKGPKSVALLTSAIDDWQARSKDVTRWLVELMVLRGWGLYKQNEVDDGMAQLRVALSLSDPKDDFQCGMIQNFLGGIGLFTGQYDSAEKSLRAAQEHHERLGDLKLIARSSNNLAILFHRTGAWKKAVKTVRAGDSLSPRAWRSHCPCHGVQ